MMAPLLEVRGLRVAHRPGRFVLRGVTFTLARGECLAVLGASGSGKSTLARALVGLLPSSACVEGEVDFDGMRRSLTCMAEQRGRDIAIVFQDPAASLHPLRRIGVQLAETLRLAGSDRSVAQALREVGLDDTDSFVARYPHMLSGGQRQRVMIALALAASPRLLIADEATSALDPLAAAGILQLLDRLRRERGLALLLISHDLHAVRRIADRVMLLDQGGVDTIADSVAFFSKPPSPLAASFVRAATRIDPAPAIVGPTVLRVTGLNADYRDRPALREVSFSVPKGAALGVVGASGSGKSTLARVLLALQRGRARELEIAGADPFALRGASRKAWRRKVQIVFQDPRSALDPRYRVEDCLLEPLRIHGLGNDIAQRAKVRELLAAVRLDPKLAQRRPHELSGGQQQRVAIARALALEPEVLVCDEAVSALDPAVQREILELLRELQRSRGLTLVFISHDLEAVRALCDRVLVLEQGRVVEYGATEAVFTMPQHPHTRALLAALGSVRS